MDAPEPTGRFGALVQLLSPRRRRASGSEDVPVDQQPAHHDSDNTNPGMQDIPSAGGSPTFAPPSARDSAMAAVRYYLLTPLSAQIAMVTRGSAWTEQEA